MRRGVHGSFTGRPVKLAAALVAALALSSCTNDAERPPQPTPAPSPSAAPAPPTTPDASPEPPEELAVIGHATLPQLRLSPATAERLIEGEVARWRGLRVVRGAGAVRAVEGDAGTIGVVPVDRVGPTVVAATVGGRDPIRNHRDATQLTVVGDVMLVRGVPDPRAALAGMADRLRAADLAVGNLESTLSTRGTPTQPDFFGGSPGLIGPLRRAGFDALSLANNHVGDYGERALLDTVEALEGSPIRPFGSGRDDRHAARPALLAAKGTTFAFIGFNAIGETPQAEPGQPGALSVRMPPRTGPLDQGDLDRFVDAVRRADRTADVVVALPHWGEQYTHQPEPVQRVVSRALVRAGVDLVVGGHPHWVQGVDDVGGVPVVHSLGNFVFDMDFMTETMEGVVLEATFWGAELKALRFVPYRMDPVTFAPRVANGAAGAAVLDDLWRSSTGPFARP